MSHEFGAESWQSRPKFGSRDPEQSYIERPSAYVVLFRQDGLMAVVRSSQGVHLPGGGHLDGESAAQAAIREVLEECGLAVQLDDTIGFATEFVYATNEDCHFAKRCTFFHGRALETIATPEPGHETLWRTPSEAITLLSPESHRWAVDQATRSSAGR